jgi:FlaA1/EpsC-like NDP-sugar epimerase
VFTGLRPGEKLYEELLNDEENTLPTYHPKIMIARTRQVDEAMINEAVGRMMVLLEKDESKAVVSLLQEVIPEFKPVNPIYQA